MREPKNCAIVFLIISFFIALSWLSAATLHAQPSFFQGKSIRVIRGGQPGDLYDLWTRHIAMYLGKHVPGNPSVTVQNMPGQRAAQMRLHRHRFDHVSYTEAHRGNFRSEV